MRQKINFKRMTLDEQRAYRNEKMKEYLARLKQDPVKYEQFIKRRQANWRKHYDSLKEPVC